MVDNADAIGMEITMQIGRPIRYSPFEIKRGFQERGRHMIPSIAPQALSDIPTQPKDGFQRFIRREPVGVVLVLAPWNYPYLVTVNSVISAILAEQRDFLKHSDQLLLVSGRFAEAFRAAGLPAGVFQYLHASHDDVARMIDDPRVDFVAFTGSVRGRARGASGHERTLHRGGHGARGCDPCLHPPGCDLATPSKMWSMAALFNSGQSCCGIQRVYVHADVYEQFVAGVVDLTKTYAPNPLDPATTLGPVVRVRAADAVREPTPRGGGAGREGAD